MAISLIFYSGEKVYLLALIIYCRVFDLRLLILRLILTNSAERSMQALLATVILPYQQLLKCSISLIILSMIFSGSCFNVQVQIRQSFFCALFLDLVRVQVQLAGRDQRISYFSAGKAQRYTFLLIIIDLLYLIQAQRLKSHAEQSNRSSKSTSRLLLPIAHILLIACIQNQKLLIKMEKLVRYRKAFYEKENDLQHGNKRKERILPSLHSKSMNFDKAYQTLPMTIAVKPRRQTPRSNTFAFCELYGEQLTHLPEYEQRQDDFLRSHSIDGTLRARMLDWMVEVVSSYKFSHKTYFDSAALMDRYFQAEQESLSPSKLHIIGVQSMLIASKMEEVYPLKIKTVYEKIAHKKLPLAELVQTEERIMRTLDYKLNSWTFFDLAMLKISMFGKCCEEEKSVLRPIDSNSESKPFEQTGAKQMKNLEELASYLSKFVLYDYGFFIENSTLLLAESVVKAAFEVTSLLPPNDFFSSSMILIELCKQRIFKNIKHHQGKFAGLNNVFKFTPTDVITIVDKFLD